MNKITDPEYLREEQYSDSGNLEKRASLHRDFGTNPLNWQNWLYSQLGSKPVLPEAYLRRFQA